MSGAGIVIHHCGRKSAVSVRGNPAQLTAFRAALDKEDFVLVAERDHVWEFRRKLRVTAGDWPIELRIEQDGDMLHISCYMFIPWSWIVVFAVMAILFIPLATFQGVPLAFLLALGLIGLAVYKQRLDFSPDAFWQGPPRKEWNDRMNRLLDDAFGSTTVGTSLSGNGSRAQ
jgi:hypothetical protein